MARKSRSGLARRVSFGIFFGLLLVALVCLPALPAYGVEARYPNQPTPKNPNDTGMTVTWDVYYGPNMLPSSNPKRQMVSGSVPESYVETHYPYIFPDDDMAGWYNHYCASVGGVEAAGMDCLSYWVVAVYDLGRVTATTAAERDAQEAALVDEATNPLKHGNDYAWWNARQLLYAGPPIDEGTRKNIESWWSDFGSAVPPTTAGWWGSGSGWGYWNRPAGGNTSGIAPNWPAGLTQVTCNAFPVSGTGKNTLWQVNIDTVTTPGSEAEYHVYWISVTGVSGRERVIHTSGTTQAPWKDDPTDDKPAMDFRVNVKPDGYSGLGWVVAESSRPGRNSAVGRWGNTAKPVNLKATLQYFENVRVTKIEIRVDTAVTVERDGLTKLRFTGHTPGGTAIRQGGRVVGYRWEADNLNDLNPEVTFYYTETENTKFAIDYSGVGTGLAEGRPVSAGVSYSLIVGGTRLVDYGNTASSR